MANEFAPFKTRARMVAAMACGFAVGAASGGLLQAEMVPIRLAGNFFVGRNHTARFWQWRWRCSCPNPCAISQRTAARRRDCAHACQDR